MAVKDSTGMANEGLRLQDGVACGGLCTKDGTEISCGITGRILRKGMRG